MSCKDNTIGTAPAPYVDIHTHRDSHDCIPVRSYSPGIDPYPAGKGLISAGIHPWYIARTDRDAALEVLRRGDLAAIGEIGLDYSTGADRSLQRTILRMQLQIASERSLPVILHCVRAYADMTGILAEYTLPAVIFHGYTGSPQQTAALTDSGYYISVGIRSFRSPKTVGSIKSIPVDLIFAETDDQEVPVGEVYRMISGAKGITDPDLRTAVYDNFKRIFNV